jgi:hypothetical protein
VLTLCAASLSLTQVCFFTQDRIAFDLQAYMNRNPSLKPESFTFIYVTSA